MFKKAYTVNNLVQFNRKLASRLKQEHGYRNMRCDFLTLPPLGDFVEDPTVPIPVLVSCEKKLDNRWLKMRAMVLLERGIPAEDQFKREGMYEELLDAFQYCEEHTKMEEQEEMEQAEKDLREAYEPPQMPM